MILNQAVSLRLLGQPGRVRGVHAHEATRETVKFLRRALFSRLPNIAFN